MIKKIKYHEIIETLSYPLSHLDLDADSSGFLLLRIYSVNRDRLIDLQPKINTMLRSFVLAAV